MKLEEFHIFNYGPILFDYPFRLGDFNLFYGKNEKGKTLTIEALIKLLYRKYPGFDKIERVEQTPAGYVIIKDDNLNSIKFPAKQDFSKVFNITPVELRNIFMIRSSDISIPQESFFYTEVTDKITGLDIGKLKKIKNKLFSIALLTPRTQEFSDSGSEKLKSRIDRAKELIKRDIPELITRIDESGFDSSVKVILDTEEEIYNLKERRRLLEDARKGAKCREARKYLEKLSNAREKLNDYHGITQEGYESWLKIDKEINVLKKRQERVEDDLNKMKEKLNNDKQELEKLEEKILVVKKIYEVVNTELKPEIEKLASNEVKLGTIRNRAGFLKTLLILFGILTGLSFFPYIVSEIPSMHILFLILIIFFSSGFLASLITSLLWVFRTARHMKYTGIISNRFSSLGIKAKNTDDFLREARKIEFEYNELQHRKYPEVLSQFKSDKDRVEEKENDLEEIINKLEELSKTLIDYRHNSRVKSLEEYNAKLEEKRKLETEIHSYFQLLEGLFPVPVDWGSKPEAYWGKKIDELKPYLEKVEGMEFSDEEIEKIENDLSEKEAKLKGLTEKVEDIKLNLSKLEKEVNNILRDAENYYFVSTKKDLEKIREILSDFVNDKIRLRNEVLLLNEVIEELSVSEREKISQLFGSDNPVSKYFSKITDGRYREVNYDSEKNVVVVTSKDGAILESWKLSSGAYDQLYLSIRLSLAERLLGGEKGFFIFDDPFIKSDYERLKRQLDLLKEFSSWGWQILYFTSKDEVLDVLEDDRKTKKLQYFELHGLG